MEQNGPPTDVSRLETPVQAERVIKAELWEILADNPKHVWTISVPLFYLAGFLVLNANLTKFGISEFDIISTRYLPAAGNFLFFLLCYALLAGRLVVSIHDWITSAGRRVAMYGPASRFWQCVVAIRSIALPTFSICTAAALYCGTALQQGKVNAFYLALMSAFALSYALETTKFSQKHPRATELIDLLIDVGGIAVFFILGESDVQLVFWIYVGISFYINMVLDVMSRRERGKELYTVFILNSAIGVLSLALLFGSSIYDKVSHRLGGGMPRSMHISVDDKVRDALSVASGKKIEVLDAKLLYQTDKHMFFDYDGRTLRVKNDDVRLLDIGRETVGPSAASAASSSDSTRQIQPLPSLHK